MIYGNLCDMPWTWPHTLDCELRFIGWQKLVARGVAREQFLCRGNHLYANFVASQLKHSAISLSYFGASTNQSCSPFADTAIGSWWDSHTPRFGLCLPNQFAQLSPINHSKCKRSEASSCQNPALDSLAFIIWMLCGQARVWCVHAAIVLSFIRRLLWHDYPKL